MTMPKVSVLMPVYNTRPEHLREAMNSILSQSFTDMEFLILNDGSSDVRVEDVVCSYGDPRIRYSRSEHNLGISGARNRLLDMAEGEYLAVMDHDDVSLPGRLEKEVTFLDEHPEVGLVGCQRANMKGDHISCFPLDDLALRKSLMLHCGDICHPSCMIRRAVLEEHGIRYEEAFSPAEDHALFCRMLPHTKFANLPEVLFLYRSWEGNTSHRQAMNMEAAKYGVVEFVRRENPELWAMTQSHLWRIYRYRLLGLPVLSKMVSRRETRWLLFNAIPVWRVKESLPRLREL